MYLFWVRCIVRCVVEAQKVATDAGVNITDQLKDLSLNHRLESVANNDEKSRISRLQYRLTGCF